MADPQGGSGPQWPGYPPQQPPYPAQPSYPGYAQPASAGAQPGWGPGYAPPPPSGYAGNAGPGYGGPGYLQPSYKTFSGQPVAPWMAQAPYAGFWIRFAAWLIDIVVIVLICVTIIGIFLWPFYMPLMWWKKGATLGQKALGLRVVRAIDGGPITGQMATGRALVMYFISGLILDLGYIWAAFEPRKRAWHDILADTVVIHA